MDGEVLEPSGVADVLRVKAPPPDVTLLNAQVANLERAADEGRDADVLVLLGLAVPSFSVTINDRSTA